MATPLSVATERPSRIPSPTAGSPIRYKPGHDRLSLTVAQAMHGGSASLAGGSGAAHVSWAGQRALASPVGPPHVGKRDELVRENGVLWRKLETAKGDLRLAQSQCDAQAAAREAQAIASLKEKAALEQLVESLVAELSEARRTANAEIDGLQAELNACKTEFTACSERLAKTHEALGLTAEKARRLESSRGRLQIDLDGTLSSLEEATRRHELQKAADAEAHAAREGELG